MTNRKSVSQKARFEIFKRDGFTCQYCGAHPPVVVLHVDHIDPVANGGGNTQDNLITSCENCNFGKGARLLTSIPESMESKAAEVAERERQIKGYSRIMTARAKRIEGEVWLVAEVFQPNCRENGMRRDWLTSIKRFVTDLGFHDTFDAMERAVSKKPYSSSGCFRYFCGICWNKLKEARCG